MPRPTANDLRRLAESADGTRGVDLAVVLEGGKLKVVPKVQTSSPLFDVRTEFDASGPGLRGGAELQLNYGGHSQTIPPTADALFITQSAVEKFVLPYYVRFRSPAELVRSRQEFFAADVIGVCHLPGSVEETIRPGFKLITFRNGEFQII